MNAYRIFEDLRDNVVEASAAHWDDAEILRKMNKSQRKAATLVLSSPGDWLLKSDDITVSDSLLTLPDDCAKPVYMEDENGIEIPVTNSIRERRLTRVNESSLEGGGVSAYLGGNSIAINQESYSGTVTLWYQQRVPDLHYGSAGTGSGASALVLDSDNEPSMIDDYYNGVYVEIMTASGADIRSLVSDYDFATFKMTITGTPTAANDTYGTITVLPIECIQFIIADATCALLAKPGSSLDPRYFEFFLEERKWAAKDLRNFLATRLHGGMRQRSREI
jgi:hypothetical protein